MRRQLLLGASYLPSPCQLALGTRTEKVGVHAPLVADLLRYPPLTHGRLGYTLTVDPTADLSLEIKDGKRQPPLEPNGKVCKRGEKAPGSSSTASA
jgi:hypothetical protein